MEPKQSYNASKDAVKQELIDIEVEDFQKICRTCLSRDKLKAITKVLNKDGALLTELFKHYLDVDTSSNQEMPQNICTKCTKEIFKFYSFKQQVLNYDKLFKEKLTKKEKLSFEENEFVDNKFEILLEEEEGGRDDNFYDDDDDDDDDDDGDRDSPDYIDDELKEDLSKTSEAPIISKEKSTVRVNKTTDDQKNLVKNEREDSDGFDSEDEIPLIQRVEKSDGSKDNELKCKKCSTKFETEEELKDHQEKLKHFPSPVKMQECKYCNKEMPSSKMSQHLRVHTKEKPFQCNVCSQSFSLAGNLKRHRMIHSGERPHVCQICGKGFIQATSLHIHIKRHKPEETLTEDGRFFICSMCQMVFKRYRAYKAHIRQHNDIGKIFVEEKEGEKSDEEIKKSFICSTCGKGYTTRAILNQHMLTHGQKSYLCTECGKGFVTKAELNSHLRVHTKVKPHTCEYCSKSFAHLGTLSSHLLTHSGHRPYRCDRCDKRFTQISHLKNHGRTHTGERPYACSFCGKDFALKGNMITHMRIHTGETPFVCTLCKKGFFDGTRLKNHILKSHGNVTEIYIYEDEIKKGNDLYGELIDVSTEGENIVEIVDVGESDDMEEGDQILMEQDEGDDIRINHVEGDELLIQDKEHKILIEHEDGDEILMKQE